MFLRWENSPALTSFLWPSYLRMNTGKSSLSHHVDSWKRTPFKNRPDLVGAWMTPGRRNIGKGNLKGLRCMKVASVVGAKTTCGMYAEGMDAKNLPWTGLDVEESTMGVRLSACFDFPATIVLWCYRL